MEITAGLLRLNFRLSFLTGRTPFEGVSNFKLRVHPSAPKLNPRCIPNASARKTGNGSTNASISTSTRAPAVAVDTADSKAGTTIEDIESLFSQGSAYDKSKKSASKSSGSRASCISSGVRLENISKSFKGVTLLKDVTWEVKKGEKVGLVGVNGAGKTTQLKIIAGLEEPDVGTVVRAKNNIKISLLNQEFDVCPNRTVKEEFLSSFKEEMEVSDKLYKVQKALERTVEDLNLMGRLLDELDLLQRKAQDVNLDAVDVKICKMMPELGFAPEDSDRLVASYSSGWQMRMSLGKILLQACYGCYYCFCIVL